MPHRPLSWRRVVIGSFPQHFESAREPLGIPGAPGAVRLAPGLAPGFQCQDAMSQASSSGTAPRKPPTRKATVHDCELRTPGGLNSWLGLYQTINKRTSPPSQVCGGVHTLYVCSVRLNGLRQGALGIPVQPQGAPRLPGRQCLPSRGAVRCASSLPAPPGGMRPCSSCSLSLTQPILRLVFLTFSYFLLAMACIQSFQRTEKENTVSVRKSPLAAFYRNSFQFKLKPNHIHYC